MKLYDAGKIIPGVIIFLLIFLYPLYSNIGGAAPVPKPLLPKPAVAKQCVLPTADMKAQHMQLVDNWRNWVVRDGQRIWTSPDGRAFNMSLTNTCMRCHNDKEKFCDQCHNYLGVKPYCWDCHLDPKQKKEAK